MIGYIKFFNKSKGYGFCTDPWTMKDYFVHESDLVGDYIPVENDRVTFQPIKTDKGTAATEVKLIVE